MDRPGPDMGNVALSVCAPGRPGPRAFSEQQLVIGGVVDAGLSEPIAQPLGDIDRDGIAHELPAVAFPHDSIGGLSPVDVEALHALRVPDIGLDDVSGGQDDGGRRGDTDRRAPLECGHGIVGPSETSQALGPIKPTGDVAPRFTWRRRRLGNIVCEKNVAWVSVERSDEVHTFAALRYTHRAGVDDSVGPSIVELFEGAEDVIESLALVQLQHEGDVFQEQPGHSLVLNQAEDLVHQSRILAANPTGGSRLAQVLTGEPGCDELGARWQLVEISDVLVQGDLGKVLPEYGDGTDFVFTQEECLVPGPGQSDLEPTNTGEEANRPQRESSSRLALPSSKDLIRKTSQSSSRFSSSSFDTA